MAIVADIIKAAPGRKFRKAVKASLWLSACPPSAGGEIGNEAGQRRHSGGRGLAVLEAVPDCVAECGADHDAIGVAADDRRVVRGLDAEAHRYRQVSMALDAPDRFTDPRMALDGSAGDAGH